MVSIRCKTVVREELEKLGLHFTRIELGEAEILESLSEDQRDQVKATLLKSGLELLDGRKRVLVQKIKNLIIEAVHHSEEPLPGKLSAHLSQHLNLDYTYLANVFSEVQGMTIEKFFISHKIERVKELLSYNDLTLTEIADKLHYSSVAHLSTQFKKVTGLTPSYFKQLKEKRRNMLENM